MSPTKPFALLLKIKRAQTARFGRCFLLLLACNFFLAHAANPDREEEKTAPPPVHQKSFFLSPEGKLYAPRDLTIYLQVHSGPGARVPKHGAPLLPAVVGGSMERTTPAPLSLKEGLNIFRQGGTNTSYHIYADGTPPTTQPTLTNAPMHVKEKKIFYGKGLTINLTANDTLSGVKKTYHSLNHQPFTPTTTTLHTFTPNTQNHLHYYTVDHVGNTEPPAELTFYLDVSPPRTRLEALPPAALRGPLRGERQGAAPPGPPIRVREEQTFKYGAAQKASLKTSEECPILPPGSNLTLSAKDNLSGVKTIFYRIGKSEKKMYRKPIPCQNLTGGQHTLVYFATDQVENVEKKHSFTFFLDNLPPHVSMNLEKETCRNQDTLFTSSRFKIQLQAQDNKAGTATMFLQVNRNQPGTYSAPTPLPPRPGIHRIHFSAVDNVGNQSTTQTQKIYLDVTPPLTEWLVTEPYFVVENKLVIDKNNRLSLLSTDLESGVKTLRYRLNQGETTHYTGPLSFTQEGEYRLVYYAVDGVGNREPEKSLTLLVKPSAHLKHLPAAPSRHPRRWVLNSEGTVTGPAGRPFYLVVSTSPEPGGQSFLMDIPKLAQEIGKPIGFTQKGRRYLRLKAGKKEALFPLVIDADPPRTRPRFTGAQQYARAGDLYFGPGLSLGFHRRDLPDKPATGPIKTLVSIDGSPYFTFKEPLEIFSREKRYLCRYYSVDHAGNRETPRETSFTVDTTPPHTMLRLEGTAFGKVLSFHSTITLSPSDNLSGVRRLYYRFDDGNEKKYPGPLTGKRLRKLPDGPHTIHYFALDNAGNREELRQYAFTLDKAPPLVEFKVTGDRAVQGERLHVSPRTRIRLAAAGKPAGIKSIRLRIDDAAEREYTGPFNLPPQQGKHTLSYHALDRVGNSGGKQTKILFMDAAPPQTETAWRGNVFTYRGRLFAGPGTEIVLTAGDDLCGAARVFYSFGNAPFKPYSRPLKITRRGLHTLRYYAADRVNNKENIKTTTLFVDAEPPKIRISYNVTPVKDPKSNVLLLPKNALVYLTAKDTHTVVDRLTYSLNGTTPVLYRNPLSNFKEGQTHTLEVTAADRAGNTAKEQITFLVK